MMKIKISTQLGARQGYVYVVKTSHNPKSTQNLDSNPIAAWIKKPHRAAQEQMVVRNY